MDFLDGSKGYRVDSRSKARVPHYYVCNELVLPNLVGPLLLPLSGHFASWHTHRAPPSSLQKRRPPPQGLALPTSWGWEKVLGK